MLENLSDFLNLFVLFDYDWVVAHSVCDSGCIDDLCSRAVCSADSVLRFHSFSWCIFYDPYQYKMHSHLRTLDQVCQLLMFKLSLSIREMKQLKLVCELQTQFINSPALRSICQRLFSSRS